MSTPVSESPARIARSTGAAPRQRGSNEKCTLTKPDGSESSSATGKDLAEGHDHAQLRSGRRHLVDDLARRARCGDREPERLGRGLHRARDQRATATALAIGLGDDERDVVARGVERLQRRDRVTRGPQVDDAHRAGALSRGVGLEHHPRPGSAPARGSP